jgi:phosphomannomutase
MVRADTKEHAISNLEQLENKIKSIVNEILAR